MKKERWRRRGKRGKAEKGGRRWKEEKWKREGKEKREGTICAR